MSPPKKIIIFCNAPFYVQQTLGLYEKYRGQAEISIFVLRVEGVYKFLQSLNLDVERLEFLSNLPHSFRLQTPVKNWVNYGVLQRMKKKYFSGVRGAEVFFSGSFHDPVMFTCLAHLSKHNRLTDFGYPSSGRKRFEAYTLRQWCYLFVCQLLTGAKTYFAALGDSEEYKQVQFLDTDAYRIPVRPEAADPKVISKFSWTANSASHSRKLLFMENDRGHMYHNYEVAMRRLLEVWDENGFEVYIKPHPRIGCSPFLKDIKTLRFIPDYIPAQFIVDEDFDAVGSLSSTALIDFALHRDNVFCFELLFDQIYEKDRSYALDLMTKECRLVASGRELLMPETVEELGGMLREI